MDLIIQIYLLVNLKKKKMLLVKSLIYTSLLAALKHIYIQKCLATCATFQSLRRIQIVIKKKRIKQTWN